MFEWHPYLRELLGEEDATGTLLEPYKSESKATRIAALRDALTDPRFEAPERVRLVAWVDELDRAQQLYLLRWLAILLGDPAAMVRRRVLQVFEELLEGEAPELVTNLRRLLAAEETPLPALDATLRRVADFFAEIDAAGMEAGADADLAPFSALVSARATVTSACILLGLVHWARLRPERDTLLDAMRTFVQSAEHVAFREQLHRELECGHMFLRYVLVVWVAESEISTLGSERLQDLLLRKYAIDPDAIVAAEAIRGFAAVAEPGEFGSTMRVLREELKTLQRRRLDFDMPPTSEALAIVSTGVLRAIGYLACANPVQLEAHAEIAGFLDHPSADALDLLRGGLPRELKPQVFRAALEMFGSQLLVCVGVEKGQSVGWAGFATPLKLSDPRQVRGHGSNRGVFWARPVPEPGVEPTKWTFVTHSVANDASRRSAAVDLRGLLGPSLGSAASHGESRTSAKAPKLTEAYRRVASSRGPWAAEASDWAAFLLRQSLDAGGALEQGHNRTFFAHLRTYGTATGQPVKPETAWEQLMGNRLRRLYYNVLPHPRFIKAIVHDLPNAPPRAQFVWGLAQTAMRSTPEEASFAWLVESASALREVAAERRPALRKLSYRVTALLALHDARIGVTAPGAFDFDAEDVYRDFADALIVVGDEELERIAQPAFARRDATADSEPSSIERERQRFARLCLEISARGLEHDRTGDALVQRAAAVVMAHAAAEGHLQATHMLRVLRAVAGSRWPVGFSLERLVEYVFERASTSQLRYYADTRRARAGHEPQAGVEAENDIAGRFARLLLDRDSSDVGPEDERWDVQLVRDRLVRRRELLRQVVALAKRQRGGFLEEFLAERASRAELRSTPGTLLAEGEVLFDPPPGLPALAQETIVSFDALGEGDAALAAFTHRDPVRDQARAFLRVFEGVPEALDFVRVASDVRRKREAEVLFEAGIRTPGGVLVLGVVKDVHANGGASVDVGFRYGDMRPTVQVPPRQTSYVLGESVVLNLRRVEERPLLVTFVRLRETGEADGELDLRRIPEDRAVRDLYAAWLRRAAKPVLLHARVRELRTRPDGKVDAVVDVGFHRYRTHKSQNPERSARQPRPSDMQRLMPKVDDVDPTRCSVGAEIVVGCEKLEVEEHTQMRIGVELHGEQGLPEGQEFEGKLASRKLENGRRTWRALIGRFELAVTRSQLTADLLKLFWLDGLDDDSPVLERLSREKVRVRVQDDRHASLVATLPAWRMQELLLAVAAGEATVITYVRPDGPGGLMFELVPDAVDGESPVPGVVDALGTFVRVYEGDLVDKRGRPLSATALRPGDRLSLRLGEGRLGPDGGWTAEPGAEPYLAVEDEPDPINNDIAAAFRSQLLEAHVTATAPAVHMELAEPLHDRMPNPELRVRLDRPHPEWQAGQRVSVAPVERPDPTDEAFLIEVAPAVEYRLPLDPSAPKESVYRHVALKRGDTLEGRVRFLRDWDSALVQDRFVGIDRLMPFLLPAGVDLKAVSNMAGQPSLRVLKCRPPRRRPEQQAVFTCTEPPDFLDRQAAVYGLVVRAPRQGTEGPIGVRWFTGDPLQGTLDPARFEVSAEWSGDTDLKVSVGDLVQATQGGLLKRVPREINATLVHQPVAWSAWWSLRGSRTRKRSFAATLLQRPRHESDEWLFLIEPCFLVGIPTDVLIANDVVADAWQLDRLVLAVQDDPEQPGRPKVVPRSSKPGVVRQHVDAEWEITVKWEDPHTGQVEGAMRPLAGEPTAAPVPFRARRAQLALPVASRRMSGPRPQIVVKRVLTRFTLDIEYSTTGGQEWLDLHLAPEGAAPDATKQQPTAQKPDLATALDLAGGRLEARGQLLRVGEQWGVVLDHYRHPDPLPMPDDERSWFGAGNDRHPIGGHITCVVVATADGGMIASLRWLRPALLGPWLERHGMTRIGEVYDLSLLYYGKLSDEDVEKCGLKDVEGGEPDGPWILFEHQAGDCFVAKADELRFLGECFDPLALWRADRITRFQVLQAEEAQAPGDAGTPTPGDVTDAIGDEAEKLGYRLNVVHVDLDLLHKVKNFSALRGIFYGRVEKDENGPRIVELRGADRRSEPVTREERGRWKLVLVPPEQPILDSLPTVEGDGDTAQEAEFRYLRFDHEDRDRGELHFRILTAVEVFEADNLVFVRGSLLFPSGASVVLEVKPLAPLKDIRRCVIKDTQYSGRPDALRLAYLAPGAALEQRIFLTKVLPPDPSETDPMAKKPKHKDPWQELSLVRVPARRYRPVRPATTGFVVEIEASTGIEVEVQDGIVLSIRPNMLERFPDVLATTRLGDVLFLESSPLDRTRVRVVQRLAGHLTYLAPHQRRSVLAVLWGKDNYRRDNLAKNLDQNCSIVGLPHLKGDCPVPEAQVFTTDPIPVLTTERRRREFLKFEYGPGPGAAYGRLTITDSGDPRMEIRDGEWLDLRWADVTFLVAPREELSRYLRELTWRDLIAIERNAPQRTVHSTGVLGQRQGARTSFTATAASVFPVDHLREQFIGNTRRSENELRHYVVAGVDTERIVLEVAPGRYVELPFYLVRPMSRDQFPAGQTSDWNWLAPGDWISLEMLTSRAEQELLPHFRIRGMVPGVRRQLRGPLVARVVTHGADRWLGNSPRAGLVLPDDAGPAEVVPVDLRRIKEIRQRHRTLEHRFSEREASLVLRGRVVTVVDLSGGQRCYVEIGIDVPVGGRGKTGDPSFVARAGGRRYQKGDEVLLRVLVALFEDDLLKEFHYELFDPAGADTGVFRCSDLRLTRQSDLPDVGDGVLVYLDDKGTARIAGYEALAIRWVETEGDSLHLENENERTRVFARLLARDSGTVAATFEGLSDYGRSARLSRRRQVEGALPAPGAVTRARLLGALSRNRLLVEIAGQPFAMHVERFCLGAIDAEDLASALSRERGEPLLFELMHTEEGEWSAVDVYPLPPGRELDGVVEFTTATGAVLSHGGIRFFVQAKQLAYCPLDAEALRAAFPRERTIRVQRPEPGKTFSHVHTTAIARQINDLRSSSDPLFVQVLHRWRERGEAVVRGPSGLVMLLQHPVDEEPADRVCVYRLRIDDAKPVALMSMERVPPRFWQTPEVHRAWTMECLSHTVAHQAFAELQEAADTDAVLAWLVVWSTLEPSPRNLRLVLEHLARCPGGVAAGFAAVARTSNDGSLESVLRETAQYAAMSPPLIAEPRAEARFALGYAALLDGRLAESIEQLGKAAEATPVGRHFDVGFALATACHRFGDRQRATILLRRLLESLWSDALATLVLPCPEPDLADAAFANLVERWHDAVRAGRLEEIDRLNARLEREEQATPAYPEFRRAWYLVNDLAAETSAGRRSELERKLTPAAEDLGDAIRHADWRRQHIDSRVFVLAAWLDFARGRQEAARRHLDRIAGDTPHTEVRVAEFWRAWLSEDRPREGADPTLVALWTLYHHVRRQPECDTNALERAWESFRQSKHRWCIQRPRCHAIPVPPANMTADSLRDWSKVYGADSALPRLLLEAVGVDRED